MSKSVLCLLLSLAAGCVQERVGLRHVSQIETRTKGISFVDDGKTVDIGMAGNTCRFDVDSGVITLDADIAQGEDDAVVDSWNGNTVVISRAGGFIMTDDYMNSNLIHIFPGRNIADARFTEEGITALISDNNSCQFGRFTTTSETTVQIDDICPTDSNQFDVNRETGFSFVATDEAIMTYGPLGFEYYAPRADKIKWDDAMQMLYATSSGRDVTAYDSSGTARWVTELNGRITAFDDMGAAESMIAMVELADGSGELVIIDSQTGQVRKTFPTPSAAKQIIASRDGETLAVVLDNETHFFTINTVY